MALDLITLAEYKVYAKINSSEQDDKLNLFIPMVSTLVKNYCGRTFVDYADTATTASTATEYFSEGGKYIYTREQPILSVSKIGYKSSVYDTAYMDMTVDVDYVIDRQFDYIYCINSEDGFVVGPNFIKVQYWGGYADSPEDLKLAVLDLIHFYVKGEALPRKSLNSNQISIEHVKSIDMPPHIKRVLELYRIH
jgi:hypothetical protein